MAFTQINDGDTGLSARTTLNEIITYLNGLGLDLEFSSDGASWHYPWAAGDDYIRFSSDFGSTWSDGLQFGGGAAWDEAQFDTANGNLNFLIASIIDATVNLDGRYALLEDALQVVFEMELPASTTVAGRISGATIPSGWSLSASGVDLIVTHNEARRVAQVSIFAVTGTEEQQLFNTAAYNGIITTDENTLKIQSLATINKVIKVYMIFV